MKVMTKPPVTNINEWVNEYNELREQKKIISARMDVLSKIVKDYATEHGTQDDKGSYYCENDKFQFGSQAKKSVSFIEDKAIKFFKTHKLHDAIEVKEVINEDAVEQYVLDGVVSFEDLDSITQTKTTYAVFLKPKEEMTEVEEVPLKSVASTKSRFKSNR